MFTYDKVDMCHGINLRLRLTPPSDLLYPSPLYSKWFLSLYLVYVSRIPASNVQNTLFTRLWDDAMWIQPHLLRDYFPHDIPSELPL